MPNALERDALVSSRRQAIAYRTIPLALGLFGFCRLAAAQAQAAVPARQFRATVAAGQILASQGQDESLQRVSVDIWGRLREPPAFRTLSVQLDSDPELEFVVVSRNEGTGPYYRLQIVASRPFGILTWSYPSCGSPRIEAPRIALGECPTSDGAGGATIPTFRWYRLTDRGLTAE